MSKEAYELIKTLLVKRKEECEKVGAVTLVEDEAIEIIEMALRLFEVE